MVRPALPLLLGLMETHPCLRNLVLLVLVNAINLRSTRDWWVARHRQVLIHRRDHDDPFEPDVIGRRPDAHHWDGGLAVRAAETAAQRLDVDGDHLAIGNVVQGRGPIEQTSPELHRPDYGEVRI